MRTDDARHGTYAGANAHWGTGVPTCEPCRAAATRYQKERKLDQLQGRDRTVSLMGTRRRIQALAAIGYSYNQIAVALKIDRRAVSRWATVTDETITSREAARVARLYERWCMTLPDDSNHRRDYFTREARRKGFLPPLAWDDIDDPNNNQVSILPEKVSDRSKILIDEVVVQRVLSGVKEVMVTTAERHEIVRRWPSTGRSLAELARLTGWKVERYGRGEAA